jgi:hypothetical protein
LISKSRVWFEEGQQQPTCKSNDAWKPSDKIEVPVHRVCAGKEGKRMVAVCPRAQWDADNKRPDCSLVYNILALNLDDSEMPFFVGLKGTSVKSAKRLISFYALRKRSLFTHSCVMSLLKTKNAKGQTFYVASFGDFEACVPPDLYREHYLELSRYDLEKTYEAEEAAGIDSDGDADHDEGGGEGGGKSGMF